MPNSYVHIEHKVSSVLRNFALSIMNEVKNKIVCLHRFNSDVAEIELPEKFTFPFYYKPHPLAKLAAKELQNELMSRDFDHNFGLDGESEDHVIGKMFGVLVVQDKDGELGYLTAFSGKLGNTNDHEGFVPPVFDMLTKDSFFNKEMIVLGEKTAEIDQLKNSKEYQDKLIELQEEIENKKDELETKRLAVVENRKDRKIRRATAEVELTPTELEIFNDELVRESLHYKYQFKEEKKRLTEEISELERTLDAEKNRLVNLKKARKAFSANLQQRLFDQYHFLNQAKETKSLLDIFEETPPSGSGECAAPKLLNYSFKNDLKPIAMAEFWWGESPKSEIRKHGNYYPACQGKCKPILGHMLKGIEMDENPMLRNPAAGKDLPIVYEDEHLLLVNKPSGFLSVPGKTIKDCVYQRIKDLYPDATGPLIVHRLDMSTSGLLLVAKSLNIHKSLQRQFINRTIKKRYVALLEGELEDKEGIIDLPLRVDLNDRPRQLVCYEHGKPATTKWEVIEQKNNRTKVYFTPITGRTHQLRVHAAHVKGLNTPIVGDDLYGNTDDRLHLHAETLTFYHPIKKEEVTVSYPAEF